MIDYPDSDPLLDQGILNSDDPVVVDTSLFCKDCANAFPVGAVQPVLGCGASGIGHHDPVSGVIVTRRCSDERRDLKGLCGPEGKLFTLKNS